MAMAMAATASCCNSFAPAASPASLAKLCSSFRGLSLQVQLRPVIIRPLSSSSAPLVVAAQKNYKMKTHQAAAKRFRVTGSGKIMCRRAGKQHLLWKKTTRRRKRLSKMAMVEKADYQNITHALPYLKVAKG